LKIFLLVVGLLYFLFPHDLIRDFIPVLGYFDDLALILWILYVLRQKQLRSKKFRHEYSKNNQPGDENLKNPYEILGISKNSSDEDVKKAYKELVSKYHPDRVEHLGEDFKKIAHEKFVEIKNAYEEIKKLRGM